MIGKENVWFLSRKHVGVVIMKITEWIVSTPDKKLEKQICPQVTPDINTELTVLNVYRGAKKQTWLG